MKTKIVTGYWMDVPGFPFWSVGEVRRDRYLGSIKSHCENIGLPIICYTHKKSIQELQDLKLKYNLSNLEIKIMELSDMKYHDRFMEIRNNGIQEYDGRGSEILWGKIQVLEKELNNCDKVYWIDAGLQHPGIFPWRFSKKYFKKEDHLNSIPGWHTEYDVFNFKKLINIQTFNNLNHITNNKIMVLGSSSPQTVSDYYELRLVDYPVPPPFPIGGLFGGDVLKVKIFIDLFWENAEKILNISQLKTEEYIMKLAYDEMSENERTYIPFDVHSTYNHDSFHFEEWNGNTDPKPLYMTLIDILNYKHK
jgi:hypothetical protein